MTHPQQSLEGMIPEAWLRFPQHIGLELSSRCPLACVMCPQSELKRDKTEMDSQLAFQILGQLGGDRLPVLMPQGMGELFLHPDWQEILHCAIHERGLQVAVLTHGSFLDEERVQALVQLQPAMIVIGVEGVTKETHEAVTGREDFSLVTQGIEGLVRLRRERGLETPPLQLRMTPNAKNRHEASAFEAFWKPKLLPGDQACVNPVCNSWAGAIAEEVAPREQHEQPRLPCPQLWTHLNVYADGRCTPCCIDHEGAIHIGNAKEQNLQEIWEGETLAAYRQAHIEGRFQDVPLCGDCSDWINYLRQVL